MRRASCLAAVLLAGCQHYAPLALPDRPRLAAAPAALEGGAGPTPSSIDDVVRLALGNNPDLRAARARRGVAEAQLVQAGLLPNPVLNGAFLPLVSGVGVVPAWTAAITGDVKALITFRARRRSARDAAGQAAADLLWQEWQVAGQARQLTIDIVGLDAQRPFAERLFDVLSARNAATQAALARGDATLITAAPTLAALQSARAARDALDQRSLQLRHQLNALLGLEPDAPLPLAPIPDPPAFDPAEVRAALATLPARRPDLLALRLGYAAQEEAVRVAVLSQFPDLVLGPQASSDSSRVINVGPQIQLGLPVFDRAQGAIAIQRATREQLHAEYAARLATAAGEVGAALAEIAQLERQLAFARRDLPAARVAAARAEAARSASAIDETAFVGLINTRYTKEQEVLALRLALLDRQVAIQTLLGDGLPQVETLPMTAPVGRAR